MLLARAIINPKDLLMYYEGSTGTLFTKTVHILHTPDAYLTASPPRASDHDRPYASHGLPDSGTMG